MARFDVFRSRDEGPFYLDCQADTLRHLNTRFCVPLLPPDVAPVAGERLNSEFDVQGQRLRMVTQFAGAVPVPELGAMVDSLEKEHSAIMNALDMLITGY